VTGDRSSGLLDVRPSGARRSWWLREELAREAAELGAAELGAAELGAADAAPPFDGSATADVAIVGGGYTGLWTALRLIEAAPGIRVTLIEADICGGGPSGRNGGFLTGWWDELPSLVGMFGDDEALRTARAVSWAVDEVGAWCVAHDIDAWYRRDGFLQVSAAPAQDGIWDEAVEACRRLGVPDEYRPLTPDEVAARVRSPVFRAGVLMPAAGTIHPARLARALRRVALASGVTIHEGTRANGLESGRGHGVAVQTTSTAGEGRVTADRVVLALDAWAAGWPGLGPRIATWSSYIVLTEPIPDRLAEIGWTGGEGVSDSRFTLHYGRTTNDGRVCLGGGGGRAGFGGRIGARFTDDVVSAERAAIGLRRWFPSLSDVRIEDAWGGPIDISPDHLPFAGSLDGGRVHYALGYSGNGVAPAVVMGRVLAGLALDREDEWTSLPLVGRRTRRFPPEPLRSLGAHVFREAMTRREQAEERGRRPNPLVRQLSLLPRRFGYHLGPED
jgi:glycine/D-amino acid oxidase-like deaminating enzyme